MIKFTKQSCSNYFKQTQIALPRGRAFSLFSLFYGSYNGTGNGNGDGTGDGTGYIGLSHGPSYGLSHGF